jgi:UDP-glucose 4-epimerase
MILITGCNSLAGQSLVRKLSKDGKQVRGFDNWKRKTSGVGGVHRGKPARLRNGSGACEDVDIIYHLYDIENPAHDGRRHMKKVNIQGTENLLKAAKECEVKKIIFLSTGEVYGKTESMLVREDDEKKPVTPYGKDKLKTEARLLKAVEKEGVDITIFRPQSWPAPTLTIR